MVYLTELVGPPRPRLGRPERRHRGGGAGFAEKRGPPCPGVVFCFATGPVPSSRQQGDGQRAYQAAGHAFDEPTTVARRWLDRA